MVSAKALPEPEEYLLAYLQGHDAVCPSCRYNLRGVTKLRCPECGREIRMEIGLVEPVVMPWVLTTVFVAMAASVGILFVAGLIFMGPRLGKSLIKLKEWPLLLGAFYGMGAVPLTVMLLRGRRKFMARSRLAQWGIAAAALLVNG
ncbi:MAG TPA: hypothetical protein VHM90_06445, partial [Phycisphaerae bacterium]|nr:hypothetical protein [Phycisphaerae bacterium]